jgi:hypothetical protein
MKKILLCLLLVMGCEVQKPQDEVQTIEYYKDSRTGLCFVNNSINNGHWMVYHVYSNVPCTPEVEKLIK